MGTAQGVPRPLGIVVAVDTEHAILRKAMASWPHSAVPSVAVSGMGQEAAGRAAERLAASGIRGLMSFGYAGAIRPGLRRGTLLIAEDVQDDQGTSFPCDAAWRQALRGALAGHADVTAGSFLSVGTVVSSPQEKARLAAGSRSPAVDMESAAVARVAGRHGLPFLTLRAIVDEAHHAVPKAASAAVDAQGRSRPWRIVLPLLRQPSQIKGLLMLARGARAADRSLAEACRLAGPGFGLA
jgi:hopanoid-associated phosphorylase